MHERARAVLDDVDHEIIASVEILYQSAPIAAAAFGVSHITPLAILFLPAIPDDANIYVVRELFGEPLKRLGLRPVHNNEFHGT